jgi:hypothetical protein
MYAVAPTKWRRWVKSEHWSLVAYIFPEIISKECYGTPISEVQQGPITTDL